MRIGLAEPKLEMPFVKGYGWPLDVGRLMKQNDCVGFLITGIEMEANSVEIWRRRG